MKDFKIYQTSGMLNFLVHEASDVRKKEQTLSGDIVSFTADEPAPLKIVVDIDSTGWTGCEVTRLGANILPYPYFDSSVTKSGITFTVNNDYTVTVNGTASSDVTFELCRTYPYGNDELVLGKTITLTGCPQNGSQSTYYLSAVITGHKDTGNGVSFAINNVGYFRFAIVIKSGVTVNNLIFKPMVVIGAEQQDYEPYSGTTLSVTFPDEVGSITDGTLTINYDGSVILETGGQTYTLTSTSPIETLIGDNNIWADAGPVSVTYPI